jgi:hypothetical protein
MNVFVLNTGRCGSTTFAKACSHITNYSSAHESRSGTIGEGRLSFPQNHIEIDNRLSWYLGRLDKNYGDAAFYVHLQRQDRMKTAISCSKRTYPGTIIRAYKEGILLRCPQDADLIDLCLDYCDTVTSNIELFLKDKSSRMDFFLEDAKTDYREFWNRIGAEGDLEAAIAEFEIKYNATMPLRVFKNQVISRFSNYIESMTPANNDNPT